MRATPPLPPFEAEGSEDDDDDSPAHALHRAARTGDVAAIRTLLDSASIAGSSVVAALLSGSDKSGETPLRAAAVAGELRACRAIISAGATIDDDAISATRMASQYDVLLHFLGRTQPPSHCTTARRDRKREMIVIELAKTERQYVEGLATLIDEVIGPCMRHAAAKAAIIEALDAVVKQHAAGSRTESMGPIPSSRSSADPWADQEGGGGSRLRTPTPGAEAFFMNSQLGRHSIGRNSFADVIAMRTSLGKGGPDEDAANAKANERLSAALKRTAVSARAEVVELFDLEADFDPDAWPSLDQVKVLSGQVEQLYRIHLNLLEMVDARIKTWTPVSMIGDIFVRFSPLLQFLYIDHIETQEQATRLLNAARQYHRFLPKEGRAADDKSSFIGFIRWTECTLLRRPVESMLASPFQRPMRYRLLLEELLKYTLPDEPDAKESLVKPTPRGLDGDAGKAAKAAKAKAAAMKSNAEGGAAAAAAAAAGAGAGAEPVVRTLSVNLAHTTRPSVVAALNAVGRLCDGMNEGLRHLHVVQLEKSLLPPQQITAPGRYVILEEDVSIAGGSAIAFLSQQLAHEHSASGEIGDEREPFGSISTVQNPHFQNWEDLKEGDGTKRVSAGRRISLLHKKSMDRVKSHVKKVKNQVKNVKKRRKSSTRSLSMRIKGKLSILTEDGSGSSGGSGPPSPKIMLLSPKNFGNIRTWHIALLSDMLILAVDPDTAEGEMSADRGSSLQRGLSRMQSLRSPSITRSSLGDLFGKKKSPVGGGLNQEDDAFEVLAPPLLMHLVSSPLRKTEIVAMEPGQLCIKLSLAQNGSCDDGIDDAEGDSVSSPSAGSPSAGASTDVVAGDGDGGDDTSPRAAHPFSPKGHKAAWSGLKRSLKRGHKRSMSLGRKPVVPKIVYDLDSEAEVKVDVIVEFDDDIDRDNWVAKFNDAKAKYTKLMIRRRRSNRKRRISVGDVDGNSVEEDAECEAMIGMDMERQRQTRALISKLKALAAMSHRAVAARLVANEYELIVATKLHDMWRSQRRVLADNSYEPRIKLLDGVAYDIANLSFVELPEHYQVSNAHAASSACGEVVKAIAKLMPLNDFFIEIASCEQHKVWIADNSAWAAAEQLVTYEQLSEPEKQKDRDIIVVAIDSYDKTAANTPAGIAGIADSASEIAELTGSSKSMSPLAAMKEARKEARKRVVSTPLSPRSRKPSSFAEVRHSLPQRKMKRGSVASRAQASAQALWSNAVVASLNAISNAALNYEVDGHSKPLLLQACRTLRTMMLATKEAHTAAVASDAAAELLSVLAALESETAHRRAEYEGNSWLLDSNDGDSADSADGGERDAVAKGGGLPASGCELQCETIACLLALATGAATPKGSAALEGWSSCVGARAISIVVRTAMQDRPGDSLLVQTSTDLLEQLRLEPSQTPLTSSRPTSIDSATKPKEDEAALKARRRRVSYGGRHDSPAAMPLKVKHRRSSGAGGTPLVAAETQARVLRARRASRARIEEAHRRFAEVDAKAAPPLATLPTLGANDDESSAPASAPADRRPRSISVPPPPAAEAL